MIDVAFAGPHGHEVVGEQHPALVVDHLTVGQTADIEPHPGQHLTGRLLQQGSGGDAVGERHVPVRVLIRRDQFLETRDHRDGAGEGFGQRQDPRDLILHAGAHHLERSHCGAVVFEEPVPGGLRVDVQHLQQLRMDAVDVIALFEGVHHDFPVALDGLGDIHDGGERLDVVGLEKADDLLAEVVTQGRGLTIRVEEDETRESIDRRLDERVLRLVDRAGKVLAQHPLQPAVEVVRPQVVLAEEPTFGVAGLGDAQRVAAVPAGVDETTEDVVFSPDDEEGLVEDLVFLPVAGFG